MLGTVHLSLNDLLQTDALATHETLQRFGRVAVGVEGGSPLRSLPQVCGIGFVGSDLRDGGHDTPGRTLDGDLTVAQA